MNIVRRGTVTSTMTEATALAEQGCAHGTAVTAEEQTAGIGRHGHSWHSEPGSGLYVSVVLRLELPPAELPILTLALGLAVSEAISLETGLQCDLRWPNDILARGRKVAGILVQIAGGAAIAGIGINVNHTRFPPELEREATSLRLETGREQSREALLQRLLLSVDAICGLLLKEGKTAILQLFQSASSYALGKRVRVDQGGGRFLEGTTAGLTGQGFLLVRTAAHTLETIVAGGVRPV